MAVNDGSTDNSAAVLKSYGGKVKLIEQDNLGTPTALNHGIQASSGELLAFLDADDLWVDNKLALQRRELEKDPGIDGVVGQMQNFISPDLPESEKVKLHCPPEPIAGNCPGTLLIHRAAFEQVGPFSTQWRVGEYLDWFIRAKEKNLTFSTIEQVLMRRRIHMENKGRLLPSAKEDYLSIIQESLQRKKRKGKGRVE